MELHLNENERVFVDAVDQVVKRHMDPPRKEGVNLAVHNGYSKELYDSLNQGGFLSVAREAEFGPVCAALLIEEEAKSPLCAEIGATALVAAMAVDTDLPGPIALLRQQDLDRPIRYLPAAKTALVLAGDDVLALEVDQRDVITHSGMYAYPFGSFRQKPDLARAKRVGDASKALLYWQVHLAAEGAALMQSALNYTVEYVKIRNQFNRPIGSFQAIKHRLAVSAQKVRGAIWLARRAAWSGRSADASMALLYTQHAIPAVAYDCHQFNGAMGMTLECPLHFWTFRLKALQGELGGTLAQADRLVREQWLN